LALSPLKNGTLFTCCFDCLYYVIFFFNLVKQNKMKKTAVVATATKTKATANVPQLKSKALANNSQPAAATKAPEANYEEDIWELKAPPMKGRTATGRGRTSQLPTYNTATCNYNDWREWGKFIANGMMRTSKEADGSIKAWAVEGEIIAKHVQNRNLDYMPETSQKYGGFVVATEENIPAVIKNIDDFYNDPVNEGIKVFFGILPEFPLTHPVASAPAIKNTGLVVTGNKNQNVRKLAQRLLAEIGE